MNLKVKQKIPLKIKRMGINGEGIGFYQKTLVFVPGALKGEDIYCQITSIRRNFVEAKLLKVNKKSKFRIVPSCTIYNECGGCQIMHLHYDKQLEFKTDLLHQALKKFAPAGYENYEIRPTIGMQEPKYYRAKLQFQTRKFKNQVKAGLYAQNSHLVKELVKDFPEVVTVAVNTNTAKTSEIYGEKTEIIWGQESIQEGVLNYEFSLSPRAFYQLNPEQTEVLYSEAVKALDVDKEDHLIDAYCGVGTIGFAFAKKVKTLRGMDIIPEAIEDAKRNAKRMGFDNTHYEAGTAEEIIPRWYKEGYRADALIVDPPRTGLDDKLLDTILTYVPEKMVYISCNVSTLARDLVRLVEVYDLHYIQSVDMFPHTARTEAVVKLIKKV